MQITMSKDNKSQNIWPFFFKKLHQKIKYYNSNHLHLRKALTFVLSCFTMILGGGKEVFIQNNLCRVKTSNPFCTKIRIINIQKIFKFDILAEECFLQLLELYTGCFQIHMLPTVQSSDKAHKRVHESNLREDQLCRLLPPTILHNQPWGASQLKWEKNKINNKSLVA